MNTLRKRVHDDEVSRVLGQVKSARLSDDNLAVAVSQQQQQQDQHAYAHPAFLSSTGPPAPSMYNQHFAVTAAEESFALVAQQQYIQHAYSQAPLQASMLSNGNNGVSSESQFLNELAGHLAVGQDPQTSTGQNGFPHGKSLPVIPQPEGFPSLETFEVVMNDYILSLSPKKRDKALIPKKRRDNIEAVLCDPKCTTIESAQFRFWAKKMFSLQTVYEPQKTVLVCHEGKPVAVRERLFQILTKAHADCQHGGRDKTSGQVRKYYSWVPKELIARFVRNCPTCSMRRNPVGYDLVSQSIPKSMQSLTQNTPPGSVATSPVGFQSSQLAPAPSIHSPPESRRASVVASMNGHPMTPGIAVSTSVPPSAMAAVSLPPTAISMTPVSTMSHSPFEGSARAGLAYPNVMGMQAPMNGVNTLNGINGFQGNSFTYDPQIYTTAAGP